jgi:hypothetical protein
MCATFVPHCFPDQEKADLRLQAYQKFIQSVDDDRTFLDSNVMAYETWFFQRDPRV